MWIIIVLIHVVVALLGFISVASVLYSNSFLKGVLRFVLGIVLITASGLSFIYLLTHLKT